MKSPFDQDKGVLIGRAMSLVEREAIDWVWKGWIPKGYITLVVGETGAGKSTIVCDIVARITTGAPWPGEKERRAPGLVLWLGSEDSIKNLTRPRLEACGANLENVVQIQYVDRNGRSDTFSLQDDLEKVKGWLELGRSGIPFEAFIIDPLTSYFGSQLTLRPVDIGRTANVRSILEPWLRLSEEYSLATMGITHFMKDTNRKMLHRVMESSAFAELCRSLIAVVNLEDISDPFAKAMIQVKTNLPDRPKGSWRLVTEQKEVGSDKKGRIVTATYPDWIELDPMLNEKTAVGQSRGPKSQYAQKFGFWVKTYFIGKAEWLLVAEVLGAALRENAASVRWWDSHSNEYVEKKNENAVWWCRLRKGGTW